MIDLRTVKDSRGNLTFIEGLVDIPFAVKRIYYSYDIPDDKSIRGKHGHKELQQLIIAMSGSFSVTLDDGYARKTFHLNRPWCGLYVTSGMWREVDNFSSSSVCMVLASEAYDAEDYIRDYDEFRRYARGEEA